MTSTPSAFRTADTTVRPPSRILRKGASTRLGVRAVAAGELTPPSERFDRAAERGYAAGYQEGRRVADAELAEVRAQIQGMRTAAAQELGQTRMALESALVAVETARDRAASESVETIVTAAFSLAEALVGRELTHSPLPVLDALRRALAEAPAGPTLVRLNPADASNLAEAADLEPFSILAPGRELTLVPDHGIEPGGCILEIGSTTVDARLSTAIGRVRRVLLGDDPAGRPAVPGDRTDGGEEPLDPERDAA